MEPLGELRRTHTCGALRASEVGQNVVLLGWVHRVRDLGSLIFLDIRDRAGVTQAVVGDDEALLASAKRLKTEMVVGDLRARRAPFGRHDQSEARNGRDRDRREGDPAAERLEAAAVLDCR